MKNPNTYLFVFALSLWGFCSASAAFNNPLIETADAGQTSSANASGLSTASPDSQNTPVTVPTPANFTPSPILKPTDENMLPIDPFAQTKESTTARNTPSSAHPTPLKQLQSGLDFSFQDPLVDAAERGNLNEIIRLLQEGYPSYTSGMYGATALMRASYRGHMNIVEALLSMEADVNAVDFQGVTTLRMALEGKHNDIARLLIANGAKIGKINDHGLYFEDGTDTYYSRIGTDTQGCDIYSINSLVGMSPSTVLYRTKSGEFTMDKTQSDCNGIRLPPAFQ